jgi:hypothetical protein
MAHTWERMRKIQQIISGCIELKILRKTTWEKKTKG